MNVRRTLLRGLGAGTAGALLTAHTPYRQWSIYRKRFLLIHTSREDPAGDVLGDAIADRLLRDLPESRAQVVRGPTDARIASLMSTGQADVAVFSRANAWALYRAAAPFTEYVATPLRVIAENEAHQFVCRDDFPRSHAYLVARALAGDDGVAGLAIPAREADADGTIPTHPGALAFVRGEALEG